MTSRNFLLLLILFAVAPAFSQSGAVRQAEKKIAQGNWSGARQVLLKSIKKDSVNAGVELALSKWFFDGHNPNQQIDSAYRFCLLGYHHFKNLGPKQKEKLKREGLDSLAFISLRTKVDSAAFNRAKEINTEDSYNYFLKVYQSSNEKKAAIELRDEAAFLVALKQNTYQSYQTYISSYPQSHRAREASERYEKLLFESRVRDHKLKSYEDFLKEFPKSPYRLEAERNVFEIRTSSGSPADFTDFIKQNSNSHYAGHARDILFHLLRETDEKIPDLVSTDSIKNVISLDQLLWAPVFKSDKYGFINSSGTLTLPLQFDYVDENYKCGGISEDILMTSSGLVTRSGKILSEKKFFKDLGYGFIKINEGSCANVIHKSGRPVESECLQDVNVMEGQFLRILKNDKVGLVALNGRPLLAPEWKSIEMLDGLVVLDRMGKKIVVTLVQLASVADGNPLLETLVFDAVVGIGNGRAIVRNGSLEGIINAKLEYELPLVMQHLMTTPFGLVRKINDQFIFNDLPSLGNERWDRYSVHRQWLRLKNSSNDKLFDVHSKKIIESNPDSLWFSNGLAFARRGDSVRVHINSMHSVDITRESKIFFIKSADSIRCFFVEQKNKKIVFDIASGVRLFTADYDQLESLTSQFFIVTRKNKKGLINTSGKIVLPVEFDAMILNEDLLSIYKDKKFGLYDFSTKRLIKPTYEKNVSPLDSSTLIAFQNGKYGLIDWSGKAVSGFEFDEIQPWSPNTVWVKRESEWSLIDFQLQNKILTRIKSFVLIKNSAFEKLAIVKQENLFGVVSSVDGVIIHPNLSFVMNLGSEDEPFYFTSKEVEEAGIVVVIYYNRKGDLLRKQVYEEEEYARIVCPQD